jgi:hypothetical protein
MRWDPGCTTPWGQYVEGLHPNVANVRGQQDRCKFYGGTLPGFRGNLQTKPFADLKALVRFYDLRR